MKTKTRTQSNSVALEEEKAGSPAAEPKSRPAKKMGEREEGQRRGMLNDPQWVRSAFLWVDERLCWATRDEKSFPSRRHALSWNTRYSSKPAGSVSRRGNGDVMGVIVQVKDGKRNRFVYLHRLIWVYHHGSIPDGLVVDHKDRNRLNNSLSNLRLVTQRQNTINNSGVRGRSLPRGVQEKNGKFLVDAVGVKHGTFSTLDQAVSYHRSESLRLHGELSPYFDHSTKKSNEQNTN